MEQSSFGRARHGEKSGPMNQVFDGRIVAVPQIQELAAGVFTVTLPTRPQSEEVNHRDLEVLVAIDRPQEERWKRVVRQMG